MESKVYNQDGKETGSIVLPESVFGVKWNNDLVYQVATAMQANSRRVTADSKNRAEVSGGGKKPWRQKGTGRARHGSSRSPIWKGGGVTHGPLAEKNYSQKINKKMKIKAFLAVLSRKLAEGEIILVQDLAMTEGKTKTAQTYLNNLAKAGFERINYKNGRRALMAWPINETPARRGFRNIPSALATNLRDVSVLDLLNYKYLVLVQPEKCVEVLKERAK